jgi:hypothetical protein
MHVLYFITREIQAHCKKKQNCKQSKTKTKPHSTENSKSFLARGFSLLKDGIDIFPSLPPLSPLKIPDIIHKTNTTSLNYGEKAADG